MQFLRAVIVGGLIGLTAAVATADTGRSTEILVLASKPTILLRRLESKGFEVQNRGPNSIFCSLGGTVSASPIYSADGGTTVIDGKTREVVSGGAWAGDVPGNIHVWCIAHTADQVTGAGTILTDAP